MAEKICMLKKGGSSGGTVGSGVYVQSNTGNYVQLFITNGGGIQPVFIYYDHGWTNWLSIDGIGQVRFNSSPQSSPHAYGFELQVQVDKNVTYRKDNFTFSSDSPFSTETGTLVAGTTTSFWSYYYNYNTSDRPYNYSLTFE